MRRVECLAWVLAVAGCSSPSVAPGQQNHAAAAGDRAAKVTIPPSALDAIARERGIGRDQALQLGEEDALFAQHLSERDPQRASWLERVVLARQLLAAFAEEAEAGGPPTDAEVRAITEARFWALDRPRMVQVVHAVVLSADEDPEAKALAERIASATSQAGDATAFLACLLYTSPSPRD